jgi:DNA-binding beta-propeller fold protein YncE
MSQQETAEIFGITFNNDGTKLYFTGANTADAVFQYSLGTAYDISSGTYDNVSLSVVDNRPCGIRFNNDGTKLFVTGFDSQRIEEYSLSTAFDISSSSATYAGDSERLNTSSYETLPRDIEFNSDGTRLFITGGTGDDITEYELSTAFDVSTATYHGEYNTSSQDGNTFSLRFNNDGSKMFMLGYDSDKVHEYNLASPYNLIDISGEHSGDVIDTSSTDNYDTDPDSDTLTITSISSSWWKCSNNFLK